ncbi:M15 family metallopeptidase [Leptothoe spongobia]|uniref:D-alanyl-D-alanine carboxypeptidase family protein n=1 Tax=Leptothoe spongobia TAU-MAC 1115 TaxID=1967444 RepID=A0A947GJY4_9CYAN|nr:M15 family metallopeptidase [Leptothoe spongobia]MBT9316378.1 D-alanyl-D-alanine carboxypeptidase family protein [Leptothoe spongobia TAU-MAC 1115]
MANFIDDIPEARRETLVARAEPVQRTSSSFVPWLLLILAILGLGGGVGFWWLRMGGANTSVAAEPEAASTETSSTASEAEGAAAAAVVTSGPAVTPVSSEPASNELVSSEPDVYNDLLGHRPYEITDESSLVTISTNAMVRLKPEAAEKVEIMIAEARAVGVSLDVISGFRSLEDQKYLFFELKAERGQTTQTRAEVSAPPGYSEHHTGYVVDFIDTSQPATELNAAFETTQAFRWLEQNAAYYGFEMSFPKDNEQNVAYEPWHWRYVGNQESLEMFYQN